MTSGILRQKSGGRISLVRCLLLLFLRVNISITIAVTVARVIGSQTSTATIVSLTLRLKLLRQATRFISTASKISLSIGLAERPGRTSINQNLKNYEEDFSPLHEVCSRACLRYVWCSVNHSH